MEPWPRENEQQSIESKAAPNKRVETKNRGQIRSANVY